MGRSHVHVHVDLRRSPARRRQAGQVVPILAVVLVLAGAVGVGLVEVAAAASRRAAAQGAADAAALAGAADGRDAAGAVARANEAVVVAYREDGTDVLVTVERRGVRAEARARWEAGPVDPPPP